MHAHPRSALLLIASVAVLCASAVQAAPPPECISRPSAGTGKVSLLSSANQQGSIEIWRFGERLGNVPFEGVFPVGCVSLEARLPSQGRAQMLRLEIEPNVAKTMMIAFEGPPTAPRDKAEALLRQAEWGDPKARERVIDILVKALGQGGPTDAATPVAGPPPCVQDPSGGFGFVTITTQPTAAIMWNGKKIGETPITRYKMPVGCSVISAITEDGKRRDVQITVESNVTRLFNFQVQ